MVLTGSLANAYVSACKREGVAVLPEYATPDAQRDADYLVSIGYDRVELIAARGRLSLSAIRMDAIEYMLNRGVDLNDVKSICQAARQEIVDQTDVGKRLVLSR